MVEVRAGTGGDEASLFAGDLFRMYSRFAEARGWKVEVVSFSEGGQGGVKEVIFVVRGTDAYGDLVKRGESLVKRIRRQEATKRTVASARTTTAKARTTTTQAKKTGSESTAAVKTVDTFAKMICR